MIFLKPMHGRTHGKRRVLSAPERVGLWRHRVCSICLLVGGALIAVTNADDVTIGDRVLRQARIVDMRDGQLVFHEANGQIGTAFPDEIGMVHVDRGGLFHDLNQAERYLAESQAGRAVVRYRRALRLSDGFWKDWIVARLILATDRADQLDQAALNFVRLLRSKSGGPAACARLYPDSIPDKPDSRVARAIDELDAARREAVEPAERGVIRLLTYHILHNSGHHRANPEAAGVAMMPIPESIGTEASYGIQLAALRRAISGGATPELMAGLDRALRGAPRSLLPQLLLLKGTSLEKAAADRDELIKATWPFLRVVIHFPRRSEAAEALLHTAELLDRLGNRDESAEILRECIAHDAVSDEWRLAAQERLSRLESSEATGAPDGGRRYDGEKGDLDR